MVFTVVVHMYAYEGMYLLLLVQNYYKIYGTSKLAGNKKDLNDLSKIIINIIITLLLLRNKI